LTIIHGLSAVSEMGYLQAFLPDQLSELKNSVVVNTVMDSGRAYMCIETPEFPAVTKAHHCC
jgi:hypothetical protein